MDKLTEGFVSAFLFRIVLPGLVLAIGLHPFARLLLDIEEIREIYPVDGGILFIVELTFFGLIAYGATIWVYQVAQGSVLPRLTELARKWNGKRLRNKSTELNGLYDGSTYVDLPEFKKERIKKLINYLSDFPIVQTDEKGVPPTNYSLERSTVLGNIIATYDMYPGTRYGIDGQVFWNQILYKMPPEARKELDGIESIAQGMLLSATAGWLIIAIALIFWVGRILHGLFNLKLASAPISDSLALYITGYSAIVIILFNYLARVSHRDYARQFRAAFDVFGSSFADWLESHKYPLENHLIERSRSLGLYLQYLGSDDQKNSSEAREAPGGRDEDSELRCMLPPVLTRIFCKRSRS